MCREEMKKAWEYLTFTPDEVFYSFMASFQPGIQYYQTKILPG